MNGLRWVLLAGVCLFGGSVAAQDALPAREALEEGWNVIEPGGDTICARGTSYAFYVREGSSDNLLIEFEGGGACWTGVTCGAMPTFNEAVNIENAQDLAQFSTGIHDFDNPENPFADYDVVYIPYCTGDVHMGSSVVNYSVGGIDYAIRHNGYTNASTALSWAYENFDAPESVFVTGCSAGALGSSFHAPNIMAQYDGVRLAQFGDSAGGYRGDLSNQFSRWGTADVLPDLPEFEGLTASDLSFNLFYLAAGARFPDYMFAQFNTAHDEAQRFFVSLSVNALPYEEALAANMSELEANLDNFRSFTAGGTQHCVLPVDEFYTYQVDGVRVRDWVADLAAGEPVDNIACADCETAELAAAAEAADYGR